MTTRTRHEYLLDVATLLSDPDTAADARATWRVEAEVAVLETKIDDSYPTPLRYSAAVLLHTVSELRRWPRLTERHRYALISLGVRLVYSAMLLLLLGLSIADLSHGHLLWLATFLVVVTPVPMIYSRWDSDPYGLHLPAPQKRLQWQMFKVGLGGAALLLVVGPWIVKFYVLLAVGYLVNAIFGERLRNWWERLSTRA